MTRRSFLNVPAESHFPIQNLPYGVFQPRGGAPRVGVAIADQVLDLALLEQRGLLTAPGGKGVFDRPALNVFLALGRPAWQAVRARLTELLDEHTPTLRDDAALRREALCPQADVELLLPIEIGDYTDFYSSRYHATNVGEMLRGKANALQENWLQLPVAYHGRASSVVVSGTDVRRPSGQIRPGDSGPPQFSPTFALDFELETGLVIGAGNPLGEPIPAARAAEHIFGLVLINDWSARDIQRWEYVPLGPFLSKSFATTISPWVVPWDALQPYLVAGEPQDPEPLDYLRTSGPWSVDFELEVWLTPAGSAEPQRITRSNMKHLYWNAAQQLAHHTINGCNLRTGDLLGSGTISGPAPDSRGCLLELTWGGKQPLTLPDGSERRFLADGDRVTLTGWGQGPGYRVGFGEATGRILPA